MMGLLGDRISQERRDQFGLLGQGLSQLAVGQPVNLVNAKNAIAERQQTAKMRQALEGSGLMSRFNADQRAILAAMPPGAAMQVISGEVFRRPAAPKVTDDMAEYNAAQAQGFTGTFQEWVDRNVTPDPGKNVRIVTGEEAKAMGLDPTRGYEVTTDNAGNLLNVSGVGGGDTKVDIDMGSTQTVGQEAVDKAYAPRYIEYLTGKGADAAGQAAQIRDVAAALEAGAEWTGPTIGIQGDFLRAITNPDAQDAKDRVEGVVQRSLKETLGSQFTEKEGERLIARAYNINLPPEVNAARLRALYEVIDARVQAEKRMAEHFAENGTLMGMEPVYVPTADDMMAAMEAVAPSPVDGGEMPSGFAESYGAIAKENGITIEELWEAWPDK